MQITLIYFKRSSVNSVLSVVSSPDIVKDIAVVFKICSVVESTSSPFISLILFLSNKSSSVELKMNKKFKKNHHQINRYTVAIGSENLSIFQVY